MVDKIKIIENIVNNSECYNCLNKNQTCEECLQHTITLEECINLLLKERTQI